MCAKKAAPVAIGGRPDCARKERLLQKQAAAQKVSWNNSVQSTIVFLGCGGLEGRRGEISYFSKMVPLRKRSEDGRNFISRK